MAKSLDWLHRHKSLFLTTVLLVACALSGQPTSTLAQEKEAAPEKEVLSETEKFGGTRPYPSDRIIIPHWRLTDGPHVRSAFRVVIAITRQSTVRVRTDGRDTALGAIVGEEGWILSKASRLPGVITCLLPDKRELESRIVGINREYDLALLKVDAKDLPALMLERTPSPKVGSWLATVGTKRGPQAVGVMSVGPRKIRHRAGTLGVRFYDHTEQPLVKLVFPDTGAEAAGLQSKDVLIGIDSQPTPTRQAFIQKIRQHSPGDWLKLRVRRGEETLNVEALLQGKTPSTRNEFQNRMGGTLSQRRFGFPQAFQHDSVLKPSDCGGPVVDVDGKVVGFNLARAGRTETYAVPTDVVIKIIEKLKLSEPAVAEPEAATTEN